MRAWTVNHKFIMTKILPAFLLAIVLTTPGRAQSDEKPRAYARVVPERKGDLAWENDLVAYRIYGPPLRDGVENSGIDVWVKTVPYPVIDKWYRDDLAGVRSYHEDHGEGCDGYSVGDTRGGGGTALWIDGKLVTSDVYQSAEVLSDGPDEARFVAKYRYDTPEGPVDEEKTITLKLGDRFFTSRSVFSRDGKPLTNLPVAAGVVTQTESAAIDLQPSKGIVAMWDELKGHGFGSGLVIPPNRVVKMLRQPAGNKGMEHALCILATDADGAVEFQVASAWAKGSGIESADAWTAFLEKRD